MLQDAIRVRRIPPVTRCNALSPPQASPGLPRELESSVQTCYISSRKVSSRCFPLLLTSIKSKTLPRLLTSNQRNQIKMKFTSAFVAAILSTVAVAAPAPNAEPVEILVERQSGAVSMMAAAPQVSKLMGERLTRPRDCYAVSHPTRDILL